MKYSFEKLDVWQRSRLLVKEVYILLNGFPKTEQYALCDQLRRAVMSVVSNIAEGNVKMSSKEKAHYMEIAYGSLMEVYCQLTIAIDLKYITMEQFFPIRGDGRYRGEEMAAIAARRIHLRCMRRWALVRRGVGVILK